MKVLVACERSGRVRDAFHRQGHDAWSCDILPSDSPGNHIQGDVLQFLNAGWDLLIAHPPCQYLSGAAAGIWHRPGRAALRAQALAFFMCFIHAPVPRICVENPQGHVNTAYRKPDQVIQPYYFGDPEQKRTCLWLKNLPKLSYTLEKDLFSLPSGVPKPQPKYVYIRKSTGTKRLLYFNDSLSACNAAKRAVTFPGIAQAMAEQWGRL